MDLYLFRVIPRFVLAPVKTSQHLCVHLFGKALFVLHLSLISVARQLKIPKFLAFTVGYMCSSLSPSQSFYQ